MNNIALVLSCEHAVNTVPKAYAALFSQHQFLLETHRGIDFGALAIAKQLQKEFNCPLFTATATRLLIDCNRSLKHKQCFSAITSPLSITDKQAIIEQYYQPYRQQVEHCIATNISRGKRVLHLSIHSFTPVMNDITRNAAIGLLYDPRRKQEKDLALCWQQLLRQYSPTFNIRLNYPYRGISDGFTSFLRRQFSDEHYLGFEIESNQALTTCPASLKLIQQSLSTTLALLLTNVNSHNINNPEDG